MNIRLNKLTIENFKKLKSFSFEPYGANALVEAENGKGKTTLYDAELWLFFDKNSDGDTTFANRPLDDDNQPIPGLVVAVEAELDVDLRDETKKPGPIGKRTFRREQHERTLKDKVVGFTSKYWVDGVPQKEKEYKAAIKELMPEDVFRMLTDLTYFLGKLHGTQRRDVLLELAGDTGTPAGFDALLAKVNGRDIKKYEAMLKEQRKDYVAERDQIEPRCDELQKGLDAYAQSQTDSPVELQGKRDLVKETIAGIEAERTQLREEEGKRAKLQADIAELKGRKATREGELAGDTSAVSALLQEKQTLEATYIEQERALGKIQAELSNKRTVLMLEQNDYEAAMLTIKKVRDEHNQAAATAGGDVKEVCYACGQKLPLNVIEDKIAKLEAQREAELKAIIERGNKLQKAADERKAVIEGIRADINLLTEACRKAETELRDKEAANKKRYAEIDAAVEACPRPNPEEDDKWVGIVAAIEIKEQELGEPVTEQLEQLEARLKTANDELTTINAALANYDNAEKSRKRIAELGDREKELAQLIADIDRDLSQIDSYSMAEAELIAEAVNGRFKHITFKLFKEHLNGGLDECCEAMLNGVPYSDMSTGQKIICGVDVINVLSEHYGVSVPLFVDHAESLTLPLEANSQVIQLRAVLGVKELRVALDDAKKAVA